MQSKSRIKYRLLYKVVFVITLLSACNSPDVNNEWKVFKYNHTTPVNSLDPAFAKGQNSIWACHHLYSTLFDFDSTMQISNNLVKSYQISPDAREYRFRLRQDVHFHDDPCFKDGKGRVLNAKDVKYSFERLLSEETKSPGSWILKDKLGEDGITVISDFEFSIQLKEAFAPFLGLLATKYCSIVPKEAVAYYGNTFRKKPVGSGPFMLKKWIEGEVLYLIKNPNYFKHKIQIDGVKASYITDKKIAFLELLNGNLDYISGLESSFAIRLLDNQGRLKAEYADDIIMHKAPYLNTEYIGINQQTTHHYLKNRSFRVALNLAIDKAKMLRVLRRGIGKSAEGGIVHPGLPINSNGYSFDKEKALSLLKDSGYLDDANTEPIVLYTNQDYLDLITFVGRSWEAIGIKVDIEVLESSLLRQEMRNGALDLFRASWIADYPDSENFLCLFYGKNPAPPNYTRYSNQEFDNLYESAISDVDEENRLATYTAMDSLIINDAPIIFLFYDETAIFSSKNFRNIEVNSLNMLEVEQLIPAN